MMETDEADASPATAAPPEFSEGDLFMTVHGRPGRRFWTVLRIRTDLSPDSAMGPDNPASFREYYGKAYPDLTLQARQAGWSCCVDDAGPAVLVKLAVASSRLNQECQWV